MKETTLKAERLALEATPEAVEEFFYGQGWTDGLPIVPPTEDSVRAMMVAWPGDPEAALGAMEPRWGEATIEKLAINAVMAGCRPEYFPVVVAAVEAMLDPQFNLHTVQSTTHPCAPLVIVNGPIARRLEINSGPGLFGPGCRANATIGRAVRLVMLNVGGAVPGRFDRATQGGPGKYTACIAENEERSPWEPLHVARGFAREASVVTVIAIEGPHNLNDHVSRTAQHVLACFTQGMAAATMNNAYLPGGEVLLVLGPEHAATIAGDGWTRADVQRFVYENARIPLYRLRLGGMWEMRKWPRWFNTVDDHALLPIVQEPEDILVIVAGGVGKHSAFGPTVGITRAVSRRIRCVSHT